MRTPMARYLAGDVPGSMWLPGLLQKGPLKHIDLLHKKDPQLSLKEARRFFFEWHNPFCVRNSINPSSMAIPYIITDALTIKDEKDPERVVSVMAELKVRSPFYKVPLELIHLQINEKGLNEAVKSGAFESWHKGDVFVVRRKKIVDYGKEETFSQWDYLYQNKTA